jgi:hypothetical protein
MDGIYAVPRTFPGKYRDFSLLTHVDEGFAEALSASQQLAPPKLTTGE